jgi:agmatine deiminase
VGNQVVLVPQYDDENDEVALNIIQQLYSSRRAVGINVVALYGNGGMIHCVTQQQPVKKSLHGSYSSQS